MTFIPALGFPVGYVLLPFTSLSFFLSQTSGSLNLFSASLSCVCVFIVTVLTTVHPGEQLGTQVMNTQQDNQEFVEQMEAGLVRNAHF